MKKLKFYVEQVNTYRREAVVESTVPTKLNVIEDLIEEMQELLIDNERSEEEVNEWIIRTRDSFSGCNRDIGEATGELQQYYESIQQQRNRIQEKMEHEEEIQRRLIEKRREQEEYEYRLEKEREQREYELNFDKLRSFEGDEK